MKSNKLLSVLGLSVIPFIISSCNGGSTEIGNARSSITGSISEHSTASVGARVSLVQEDFVPGGDLTERVFTDTTDCAGDYFFTDIPKGNYYLSAEKGDKILLEGPFVIENEKEELKPYILQPSAHIVVKIADDDTLNAVYVKGTTTLYQKSGGTVELAAVPQGEHTIIGYQKTEVVPVTIAAVASKQITLFVPEAGVLTTSFNNTPPRIITDALSVTQVVPIDTRSYSLTIEATDSENDSLFFTLASGPKEMTIDRITGTLMWQPEATAASGTYTVTVDVTDARGAASRVSFEILIAASSFSFGNNSTTMSGKTGTTYMVTAGEQPVGSANAYRFSWGDGDTSVWQKQNFAAHSWKNQGEYTVSYQVQNAQDGSFSAWSTPLSISISGNCSSVPPVITLFGRDTITLQKSDPQGNFDRYIDVNNKNVITAVDPEGSPVVITVNGSDVNFLTTNIGKKPYEIIYTARDTCNNVSQKILYVFIYDGIITDTNAPNLQIGDSVVYLNLNKPFVDPGATAYDLEEGRYVDCTITGSVDVTREGTYTLTYSASDSAGNTITMTRKVVVTAGDALDTVPPVITLKGDDTLFFAPGETIEEFTANYVEPGWVATDNIDADISSKVIASSVTSLSAAYYFISYSVIDNAGNNSETVRRMIKTGVAVIDDTPPLIILIYGDSLILHPVNKPWVEPGFVALDAEGDNIPDSEVVVDSSELVANLANVGIYSVTYTVTDSKGLTSKKIRKVQVAYISGPEPLPPVITLIGRNPDTCLANTPYVDPGYTAMDDRDGDVTAKVIKTGEIDITRFGKYTITYSVRDSANNMGRATREVWVVPDLYTTDLLVRYNVPSADTLGAVSGTFTISNVDGPGPDFAASNLTSVKFLWMPPTETTSSQLQFQIQYFSEPYIKDFSTATIEAALSKPGALIVLSGTTIPGLDDAFYVSTSGNNMVWVQKDGKYAIILGK